jgi:hypothetical protein
MPANNTTTSKALFAIAGLVSGFAFAQVPMPLPISAPQPGVAMHSDTLTFRDPSKPITIGEISELQAKKANAELYKKFGFTGSEPVKIKPKVEVVAKPVPTISITTLSVWGKPDALQAEAMVDGVLRKLKGGETLAPGVVVTKIVSSGLQLDVPVPAVAASDKNSPKRLDKSPKVASEPARSKSQLAYVGRALEVRL